jgi:hypothetical protein
MTDLQKQAYAALHETAERLQALTANARSSDHPLTLSAETRAAIATAVQALHSAQRSMEQKATLAEAV